MARLEGLLGNPYCNDSEEQPHPAPCGNGKQRGEWFSDSPRKLTASADCRLVLRLARERLAACRVLQILPPSHCRRRLLRRGRLSGVP